MKKLICWIKSHDFEKDFYRTPVYQYWALDDEEYIRIEIFDDFDDIKYFCNRCRKWISK